MRILVLGGTRFVGRHLVDELVERGYRPTLFHRHPTDVHPELEHRFGDRDGGLDPVAEERWDVVIDVSGYVPRLVRDSVRKIPTSRYVFVSTISVYAKSDSPGEDDPVFPPIDDVEIVDGETYAGLKTACEREVREGAERWTIVRPTVVVGPGDPSDRLGYWVRRARRGTPYPAPARIDQPVQLVHARDLARAIVNAIETGTDGTFNLAGDPFPFADLLTDRAVPVSGWEADARPFVDLPLAMPSDGSEDYFFRARNDRAKAALDWHPRPLAEILREAQDWVPELPPADGKYGRIAPAIEAAWLARAARAAEGPGAGDPDGIIGG